MKRVLFVFAVASAAGLGLSATGCDRTHLREPFGVPVRTAMAQQIIDYNAGGNPDGGVRQGLDPQEAAIVHENYRKSLSPRGSDEAARRTPVLVVPAQPQSQPASP